MGAMIIGKEYNVEPGADLSGAELRGAYLIGVDLRDADLSEAKLTGANLRGADLSEAYLSGADLRRANLSGADLRGANLRGANLSGANLSGADLRWARLSGADLRGAKLPDFQICPQGDMHGYKKVEGQVIRLLIPADAKRTSSLVGRKCRSEYAVVDHVEGWSGVTKSYGPVTEYMHGATVHPDAYDDDIRVECTHGIHFFMTRKEAEEWVTV